MCHCTLYTAVRRLPVTADHTVVSLNLPHAVKQVLVLWPNLSIKGCFHLASAILHQCVKKMLWNWTKPLQKFTKLGEPLLSADCTSWLENTQAG